MSQLSIEMAGITDTGRVRDHNEDTIAWDSVAGWAILADGMGGHLAGEVASRMAVEIIADYLAGSGEVGMLLREAVEEIPEGTGCPVPYLQVEQDRFHRDALAQLERSLVATREFIESLAARRHLARREEIQEHAGQGIHLGFAHPVSRVVPAAIQHAGTLPQPVVQRDVA